MSTIFALSSGILPSAIALFRLSGKNIFNNLLRQMVEIYIQKLSVNDRCLSYRCKADQSRAGFGICFLEYILARRDVAIVSEQAGTTRDSIEVRLDIGGVPVTLTDTAGMRNTVDLVEIKGIERTKQKITDADLVLIVVNATDNANEFEEILRELQDLCQKSQPIIMIKNKCDLLPTVSTQDLSKLELSNITDCVSTCALSHEGSCWCSFLFHISYICFLQISFLGVSPLVFSLQKFIENLCPSDIGPWLSDRQLLSASEGCRKICIAFEEDEVKERTARKWFQKFPLGVESLQDAPRTGRPLSLNYEDLRIAIETNSKLICVELSNILNENEETIISHLHQLGKRWKLSEWVLHSLTTETNSNGSQYECEKLPQLTSITITGKISQRITKKNSSIATIYDKTVELECEIMSHPPYSPSLSSTDSHLFLNLNNHMRNKKEAGDELSTAMSVCDSALLCQHLQSALDIFGQMTGTTTVKRVDMAKGEDERTPLLGQKLSKLRNRSTSSESWSEKSELKTSNYGIFTFATSIDYLLVATGTLASFIHGVGFPLLAVVLGGMTTIFLRTQNSEFVVGKGNTDPNGLPGITQEQFDEDVGRFCLYYLILGVAMFITSYIQIVCWETFSERITHRLRQTYLRSILRQQIAWFDEQQTGNLTARLTDDLERVREGLGDKLSLFLQMLSAFLAGFGVGFFYSWSMTLVMMAMAPFVVISGAWMSRIMATGSQIEQETYAVSGAIAEETFSSIRSVYSLNGQKRELARYFSSVADLFMAFLVCYLKRFYIELYPLLV
uniref:ABC transmembrane type-1 domain-containing protein n=1 Tax=Heterorhabditis bacteriophora TaxID=37862 RepID=A0A1I7X1Z2_HETBA